MRARLVAAMAGLAMLGVETGGRAQEPGTPSAPAPGVGSAQPLSLRYRFLERYGLIEDLERPDLLVEYQVGSIETYRFEEENARGAPERREVTSRTIYTERPARVGRVGEVLDTVRRYDSYRPGWAAHADPRMPLPLQGLTVWYHARAGSSAELISLTPNRPIHQAEYDTVIKQIFLPRLTGILPPRPARVADTWKLSRQAARVLMTEVPNDGDFDLEATLTKVEKAAEGTALSAIIDISGELDFEEGNGAVRARLWFVFEPPPAAPAEAAKGAPRGAGPGGNQRDTEVVEARGHTTKLVMSLRKAIPMDKEGRLQRILTGELHLQRRRVVEPVGAPGAAPLTVPEKPPAPTEANSWLIYDDPKGRFHFRHPQELIVRPDELNPLVLLHEQPDRTPDGLILTSIPREEAARDRKWSDPAAYVQELNKDWERRGADVIPGQQGWLPDQDWAASKRRVYRFEAALRKQGSRYYMDDYLVLTTRGDLFNIQAMTERDDHIAYRNQVEGVIRSLEPGPSTGVQAGPPSPQPSPQPSPRPAAAPPAPEQPAAPAVPRLDRRP